MGPAESDTAAEQPIGVVLKAWPSFYEYSIFYVSVGMGCRGCGLSPLVAAMPCEGLSVSWHGCWMRPCPLAGDPLQPQLLGCRLASERLPMRHHASMCMCAYVHPLGLN